jgi:hypothetical protein
MASGDAQRAWFPEMIETLKNWWTFETTWPECSEFCKKMTSVRENIRKDRNIKPSLFFCKQCQEYHYASLPPISIRSMLFTLKKIGTINDSQFKELDKNWKKYKKENDLDPYGKPNSHESK